MSSPDSTAAPRPRLTTRQKDVLGFVAEHIGGRGFPPTVREISDGCRLGGPSAAVRILTALERDGYVRREPGRSRAITLIRPPLDCAGLSSRDRVLLSAMLECQAYERDVVLAMAAACPDGAIKSALIEDAVDRHRAVGEARVAFRSVLDPDRETASDVRRAFDGLGRRPWWPAFVVDRLVLNGTGAIAARAFAHDSREIETFFGDLAIVSERAADAAHGWLEELIPEDPHSPAHVAYRRRAQVGRRTCLAVGSAIERQGGPPLPVRPSDSLDRARGSVSTPGSGGASGPPWGRRDSTSRR